jgi:hypothetical protein
MGVSKSTGSEFGGITRVPRESGALQEKKQTYQENAKDWHLEDFAMSFI